MVRGGPRLGFAVTGYSTPGLMELAEPGEHRAPGGRCGVGGGGLDHPGGQSALRRPQGLPQGVLLVIAFTGGGLSRVQTPLGQQRLGNLGKGTDVQTLFDA